MDLVLDYASPVPAILTMKLMGLPYDNWHLYANLFHSVMAVPQDSDEYLERHRQSPRHDARGHRVRGRQKRPNRKTT